MSHYLEPISKPPSAFIIRDLRRFRDKFLVKQDHRAVKRIVRAMLGFMSFRAASITLRGIELVHMLKKGQMNAGNGQGLSAAEEFYSLAA